MALRPTFTVRRCEPVMVVPAKPTPNEFKCLSDIDDQPDLRFLFTNFHFYRNNPSMRGRDPAAVIREALAKALVYYYPLAGRLREGQGRKLVVECTGEGVVFVEADADVGLEQFGEPPRQPFTCAAELICDVGGSGGALHCPLLFIQVTRLTCGGFIVGVRYNHTMIGVPGLLQFMTAVGEIARGAAAPSVPPAWSRELLTARSPPKVTHVHREYDAASVVSTSQVPPDPLVCRSFFFGPSKILALRQYLPPSLRSIASDFVLVTACTWRCRTAALVLQPDEEVLTQFSITARDKFHLLLPAGYYGNTFATPVAMTTAGMLCNSPLGYAVELVRKAKATVTADYIQSVADLVVLRGRPRFKVDHAYTVTDVTQADSVPVDFGWGMPVFAGPTNDGLVATWAKISLFTRSRNNEGEAGILVPMSLPAPDMDRFAVEIDKITGDPSNNGPVLSSL